MFIPIKEYIAVFIKNLKTKAKYRVIVLFFVVMFIALGLSVFTQSVQATVEILKIFSNVLMIILENV